MVLESARKIALTILVVFIAGFYIDDVVRRFKKIEYQNIKKH